MKISRLNQLSIIFIMVSLFFLGCSEKSATKYSDKNPQYAQLAKYTKIAKIIVDNEVKAIANITYLNGAEENSWNDGYEHFLVGLYGLDKVNMKESLQIVLEEELLPLVEEKKLTQKDAITQNIPFKNNWASYKIVKYKDIEAQKTIVLRFIFDEKNYQDISFIKE
jgi:hypothetical protein